MSPAFVRSVIRIFPIALAVFTRVSAEAVVTFDAELAVVDLLHDPAAEHCDQLEVNGIGDRALRFAVAFGCGDELFETRFNALDGVGMNVGDEQRFTRVPRAAHNSAELWGVGSTAPYLHDGRATTITEAVIEHGGEAAASRNLAQALRPAEQAQIVAFLENLVLFKIPEAD